MKRIILEKLTQWQENQHRKPLLIRGARQVGKSWAIKEFGNSSFSGHFHTFNFERNPELSSVFAENLDSHRILRDLELVTGKRIIPGEDLVFFDEIQDCPGAISSLRYFYEEMPDLHIIGAGSLIEFGLQEISVPVGRLQTLVMHPMNFIEFLWAAGKDLLADRILQQVTDFSGPEIEIINRELEKYFLIGGMPECVKRFSETGSFQEAVDIQHDLLTLFRQDFSKYGGHSDRRCLSQVLDGVANGIGSQVKYTHLASDFTQPTIKKAFELLETARLYSRVEFASPGGLPLRAGVNSKRFKCVFLDIGLLSNRTGHFREIGKGMLDARFRGMMAEQFIGQELRFHLDEQLFYWSREKRGSTAETDYLIECNGQILPVEVKSGSSGKLTSLHLLMDSYSTVKNALVFTENGAGILADRGIKFWPLFAVCNRNVFNPLPTA